MLLAVHYRLAGLSIRLDPRLLLRESERRAQALMSAYLISEARMALRLDSRPLIMFLGGHYARVSIAASAIHSCRPWVERAQTMRGNIPGREMKEEEGDQNLQCQSQEQYR